MYPLLSASPCSITSSHFPLAFSPVLPWATGAEVWHNSPDISQEADWPWCCRCYAWGCSVLRRPQPWEHGALRNVSKYSFTHSLPAFVQLGSYTTSPPQPGIHRDSGLEVKEACLLFHQCHQSESLHWQGMGEFGK